MNEFQEKLDWLTAKHDLLTDIRHQANKRVEYTFMDSLQASINTIEDRISIILLQKHFIERSTAKVTDHD